MASGENINILVLDTEVYSNTGGQMSKSTPLAATAQFAAGGKRTPKKNLGLIVATYGSVYVAQIAFGASPAQTVKALSEAEAHDGPSIVIAYSTCVAHGINMTRGIEEQKRAVACGHWPLYRYNPALETEGKGPLVIDSKEPSLSVEEYAYGENRYRSLKAKNPELAAQLMEQLKADIARRWNYLKHLASWTPGE
jgi:pyruvate-ferredoxin/flavodoxin oxidoreductase